MSIKKLFLSGFAALAITASLIPFGASASAARQVSASGVNVSYRTQEQIRNYVTSHPFSTTDSIVYTSSPDLTLPYADAGALSSSTLDNGLNALNVMRYVAGLSEVTLNSEYNRLCQNGAYISALNAGIDHFPSKPLGISDNIFLSGYDACGHSNLAAGLKNPADAVLGYMDDSDPYNISVLGHRRWILNPAMKQTGFGQVDNTSTYRYYSAMYAHDMTGSDTASGVCWPAQNMPTEYFGADQAWSWSLGKTIPDTSAVKVTLTRKSDGKVWTFSNGSANFYVENSYYGQPGCVIFRPSGVGSYKSGDVFTVHIDGLEKAVDYTVNFFSVNTSVSSSYSPSTASGKPSAVTGFSATPSANSIALSWDKVSNADSYQIDVYKNGKWTYLTKTTSTSYTVTGLSANTSYQFRAWAFKGNAYSNAASITATTKSSSGTTTSGKPSAVTGFSASPSANSIALSWNKVSSADSYQIDVYKNGKWAYLTKTENTSYTVTGLSANTNYQFKIWAFNGSQHSASASVTSTTKSASSSSAAKPAPVTNFTAVPETASSVKLAWSKSANADSYQIDVYKNGKWTYLTKTTGLSFTATGLSEGVSYTFRIWAFNDSVHSASTSVEISTKPAAVTGLTAMPSSKTVRLSWKASTGADSYQIDKYENGRWVYVGKTTDTSYTVTGLSSGYIYNFRVYAFRGNSYSPSVSITAFAI